MYLYAMCPCQYNFVLDGAPVEIPVDVGGDYGSWECTTVGTVLFHPALVRWGVQNSGDALAWRDV